MNVKWQLCIAFDFDCVDSLLKLLERTRMSYYNVNISGHCALSQIQIKIVTQKLDQIRLISCILCAIFSNHKCFVNERKMVWLHQQSTNSACVRTNQYKTQFYLNHLHLFMLVSHSSNVCNSNLMIHKENHSSVSCTRIQTIHLEWIYVRWLNRFFCFSNCWLISRKLSWLKITQFSLCLLINNHNRQIFFHMCIRSYISLLSK